MTRPFRIWQNVYIIGSAELAHPYDCCVYLIDFGELILIDTGTGESFNRLVDNIFALGFSPEKLSSIIATHCHIDHIGSLAQFRQDYNVKIIVHELDARAIETGAGVGAEAYGIDYQPCPVDIRLGKAKQSLRFGDYELKILHIPGHTTGSIVVYADIAGKRILFGQDMHGPYETAWGSDPKQAINSLPKLVTLKADILCEGHFGIYQPADKVNKYIEDCLHQLQQRTMKLH